MVIITRITSFLTVQKSYHSMPWGQV